MSDPDDAPTTITVELTPREASYAYEAVDFDADAPNRTYGDERGTAMQRAVRAKIYDAMDDAGGGGA